MLRLLEISGLMEYLHVQTPAAADEADRRVSDESESTES